MNESLEIPIAEEDGPKTRNISSYWKKWFWRKLRKKKSESLFGIYELSIKLLIFIYASNMENADTK